MWADDFSPDGFGWIDANDWAGNVVSFLRLDSSGGTLACIANFSATPHHGYRIGLPVAGRWLELINTDAETYGGSGVGNMGVVVAGETPSHGRPASAEISIPPLGVLWLAPDSESPAV